MSVRRTVTRNVLWNWAGLVINMVSGFVVAPILVHRMGDSTYGLWVLILSVINSLGLLDLGLRGSIGRHIALYRAKQDPVRLSAVMRTAQVMLTLAAAMAMMVMLGVQLLFTSVFDVPVEQVTSVRIALVLAGMNVAITLAMGIYDARLWAYERFDLINAVEVATSVTQAVLAIWLVSRGHSVLTLTVVILAMTVVRESSKAGACFILAPIRDLPAGAVNRDIAIKLFRYAFWNSLWTLGQRLTAQGLPMVVGARLGLPSVTSFNVAASLTGYARSFVSAGTNVATPVATAFHASDRLSDQQRLFLEGTRYAWALSMLLVTGLALLGKPFIVLWMGPAFESSGRLLLILALGEMLPMSQGIAGNMVMAMNRHRVLAGLGLIELVLVIGLSLVLAQRSGLAGVCLAAAVCGTLFRGIVPTIYLAGVLQLTLRTFIRQALAAPIVIATPPAIVLALLVHHRPVTTWMIFVLYGLALVAMFVVCAVLVLRRDWITRYATPAPLEVESA